MGLIENPYLILELQPPWAFDGAICVAGPSAWVTTGSQLDLESTSNHDGVHVKEKGELQGAPVPLYQDSYIAGTAGLTGKPFTVISGNITNWVNTRTQKTGLLAAASNGSWDTVQQTPGGRIFAKQLILGRGPLSSSITNPTASNFNIYVELCHANSKNFQIAIEHGRPLRLDYYDGVWHQGVSTSEMVYDLDAYFDMNGDILTLGVIPDYDDGVLRIRCGNVVTMKFAVPGGIPNFENIRWYGQNAWARYEEYPFRFKPLNVQKSARDFGDVRNGAFVALNSRGMSPDAQVDNASLTGNGQEIGFAVNSSLPDAGEGIGSLDPVKGVDYTVIVPAVWVTPFDTGTIYFPPAMNADILETLDDATQTTHSSCIIPVNNYNDFYTNAYGHTALTLGVGTPYDQYNYAFRGIGGWGPEGIKIFQLDPDRIMTIPGQDESVKMMVPFNEEVCFDGWYARDVIEFCMEVGNIRRERLNCPIPFYSPPGAPPYAPYGPAKGDAPLGFILPSGTGLQGKWTFLPSATPWDVLQKLVLDLGEEDPITGANVPYYMGFDLQNNFNFAPFNPRSFLNTPRISYSDYDPTGYGLIKQIEVYNSIYQMRSSIDLQGVDARTNELLYFHLNMPDIVLKTIGYRWSWLERDARFASEDYMIKVGNNAAVQASRPTQVWRVKVPYHPHIHVGMNALTTSDALKGTTEGYITEIRTKVGVDDQGFNSCYSWVTMRSIYNF